MSIGVDYSRMLFDTSQGIREHFEGYAEELNRGRVEPCQLLLSTLMIAPFLVGIGLSAYHGLKAVYRVFELTNRVALAVIALIGTILTLGLHEGMRNFSYQRLALLANSTERVLMLIPQIALHLLSLATAFIPHLGLAFVNLALRLDGISDRNDSDLQHRLNRDHPIQGRLIRGLVEAAAEAGEAIAAADRPEGAVMAMPIAVGGPGGPQDA